MACILELASSNDPNDAQTNNQDGEETDATMTDRSAAESSYTQLVQNT